VRARLQPSPLSVGSEAGPGERSGGEDGLAVAAGTPGLDDVDADAEKRRQRKKTIWPLTAPPASPFTQDLSF